MKALFTTFVLALALLASAHTATANDDENVYVNGQYLSSDGDNYGMTFSVSSSVPEPTCVFPYVTSSDNVVGGVGSPYQLGANEQNVHIGQFNRADSSRGWSVQVSARWHRGGC
jgi:hypothetical protein